MTLFSTLYGEDLTRELHSPDSTQLFTTARRQDAINKGQAEFAELTECLRRESTISCSNGVAEYDLLSSGILGSTDFLRLSGQGPEYRIVSSGAATSASTTYIAGDDFPRIDVERLDRDTPGWRDSTGDDPASWYLRAHAGRLYFGLYPPPSIGSSEVASLRMPYIAMAAPMSADTDVPFTVSSVVRTDLRWTHQALVHYAAYELEKLRPDVDASQRQLQLFVGYVTRYLQRQWHKGGGRITLARKYFADAANKRATATGSKVWWNQ